MRPHVAGALILDQRHVTYFFCGDQNRPVLITAVMFKSEKYAWRVVIAVSMIATYIFVADGDVEMHLKP